MVIRGDGMDAFDKKYVAKPDESLFLQDSILSDLPEEIVQTITPAKMHLINLYLSGCFSIKNIATQIGVSYETARKWLLDDGVQEIIRIIQGKQLKLVQSDLNNLRSKAVKKMEDLLDSNMDNVAFQAARDILDRTGMKSEQKISVNKTVTTLEQQMKDLADFTISEEDIIDIDVSDVLDEVTVNAEVD